MSYAVDWDSPALRALADIWNQAPNPGAVTAATHRIDALLAANPRGVGRPVTEGLYALDAPPLRALYEINTAARTVTVVGLSWIT